MMRVTGIDSTSKFMTASNEAQQEFMTYALIGSTSYPVKNMLGTSDVTLSQLLDAGKGREKMFPKLQETVNNWFSKNYGAGADMKKASSGSRSQRIDPSQITPSAKAAGGAQPAQKFDAAMITTKAEFDRLPFALKLQFANEKGLKEVPVKTPDGNLAGWKVPLMDLSDDKKYANRLLLGPHERKYYVGNTIFDHEVGQMFTAAPKTTGNGLLNTKVRRRLIRGRGFSDNVDNSVASEKPKRYAPLGKHFINRIKLGSGLLMIRRSGGNTIPALPTTKVSGELQNIVEGLIDGMQPSFGSVYGLTDEEKDLYNDIILHTSLDQRLKIPAPKLTKEQQLYHRYQVLCGELDAGNNSPEMIKELKSVLVQLANKKILPKANVHDVLLDLAALGY